MQAVSFSTDDAENTSLKHKELASKVVRCITKLGKPYRERGQRKAEDLNKMSCELPD